VNERVLDEVDGHWETIPHRSEFGVRRSAFGVLGSGGGVKFGVQNSLDLRTPNPERTPNAEPRTNLEPRTPNPELRQYRI